MSYADKVFKGMCRDILDNGVSTEGEKVRPVWEDTNEDVYKRQVYHRSAAVPERALAVM